MEDNHGEKAKSLLQTRDKSIQKTNLEYIGNPNK